MYPAPIEHYCRPQSVADVAAQLAEYPPDEALCLAGGQSLMQAIKSRMIRPRCVIDLQDVAELRRTTENGGLHIGAMTRYVEIAEHMQLLGRFAALRDAAQHVGDRQVRNRGTIGGSLCWNYGAACMPGVALALDATLELVSKKNGVRRIAIDDFLVGPLETARKADEVLVRVSFDDARANGGSAYRKWGLVTDALPVVGICVYVTLDGSGVCQTARAAATGLAPGACRLREAEHMLVGTKGETNAIGNAFAAAAETAEAQADKWASEKYRRFLIRSLGRDVATLAFARANEARGVR